MGILASIGLREGRDYEREKIIWYANNQKFILADFFIPLGSGGIIIECDGEIHQGQKGYDNGRDKYFRTLEIRTLRFTNHQVLKETEIVQQAIIEALGE